MSFSKQNQKTTTFTITSESGARRIIGRGGANIKAMRHAIGNGLYVRVEGTKTRRVSPDQLNADGYVTMTCKNSNGDSRTVSIFVGTSPPRDSDGNVLVMVKPVMVSAWGKTAVAHAIKQIDATTNQLEADLTTKVLNCPSDLIKHVIGTRGSGLRRLEREIGDGCYIACSEGVFVVKANHKKSALRGKIVVEKKIKNLVQSFQAQKKPTVADDTSFRPGSTNFSIFAEDSDDESDDDQEATLVASVKPKKVLSKSVVRRIRRKTAKANAEAEKLAAAGIASDPAVMFVSSPLKRETTGSVEVAAGGWASDSSTVEDTVDTTSDSAESSPPLSGVWGTQTVTISESLEDAATRGDTFTPPPAPALKKRSRPMAKVEPKEITFEIMSEAAVTSPKKLVLERDQSESVMRDDKILTQKFSDMAEKFSVGTWGTDSDDE